MSSTIIQPHARHGRGGRRSQHEHDVHHAMEMQRHSRRREDSPPYVNNQRNIDTKISSSSYHPKNRRRVKSNTATNDQSIRPRITLNLVTLSVILATASVSFITLPSFITSNSTIQSLHRQPSSTAMEWSSNSKKKKTSPVMDETNIIPTDEEAEHFFRTGMLPESKQIESAKLFQSKQTSAADANTKQSQNVRRRNTPNNQHVAKNRESLSATETAHSQRIRRNRLMNGLSISLAEMEGWPPLYDLIGDDGNIAEYEDISWLLDFAIIGFPKTGTTSLLRHLAGLTDTLPTERCDLVVNGTAQLLRDIYDDREQRLKKAKRTGDMVPARARGLKCPQDVSSKASIDNYARYFHQTKLVVGIRHPIQWFESLYNFRVSNVPWKTMLHTSKLKGGCPPGSQGVCAWRANFHDFLSQLGKTPMTSQSELDLLQLGLDPVKTPVGKVFLYEVSQLSESEDGGGSRSTQFRDDLRDFLELTQDIPPFPTVNTAGKFDHLAPIKQQVDKEKIDICDPEHDEIREVLLEKAKLSSRWIRSFFLQSDDVVVSSRQHFRKILDTWNHDPCDRARTAAG
jgi:hypothetical protein